MSKKVPLGVTIALIFVTIAVTVAVTITVYMQIYNTLIQDLPQRAQLYSELSEIDELVRANFHGDVDSYVLDESIARGYIQGLGDKYSKYMSAEEYAEYYNTSLGNASGTGISASYDTSSGCLIVDSVLEDSPAATAGLEKGDYIVSVESEAVTKENYSLLLSYFGGEKLTGITLDYVKPNDNGGFTDENRISVNVAKGYKSKSVFYSVNDTIGYIRITDFFEDTGNLFENAVSALNQSGVSGIIIDVRNNASVNYEYAVDVIDFIVPLATEGSGAIATSKNSNNEIIKIFPADAASLTLPVAVLVNSRTEGAAELLACDLRDYGLASVIGSTTAGHGTVQNVFRLDDGGAVLLTVGKIYPYISESYDGKGITPDVPVDYDVTNIDISQASLSEDAQYLAAYSLLSE